MMRKFLIVIVFALSRAACAFAEVEPDVELHKIIGGLYSLVSAVELNDNAQPHINQIRKFFAEIPKEWQSNSQIIRVRNSIWVGVSVGKFSSARNYLRSHSEELGITESPEGYEWMGGNYAWIKAADVVRNEIVPVNYIASEGDNLIFFSTPGQNSWWQSNPKFTAEAAQEILNRYGINQPDLHVPEGTRVSIYDSVRPASVGTPEKMHVGRKKSSFDMELEIGDIIFDPIPNRQRN